MSRARTGGLLLAAGRARRFGSDKRFAKVSGDETMLARSARLLAEAVDDCLLVIGSGDDLAAFTVLLPGWRIVRAEASDSGMGASLAAGTRAAPAEWEGMLVALADKPFVKPSTLQLVRATLDAEIVVPRHGGEWGHPVAFPKRLFPALAALAGDVGARGIIERERSRCRFLDVDDAGVLIDVDTPAALATAYLQGL